MQRQEQGRSRWRRTSPVQSVTTLRPGGRGPGPGRGAEVGLPAAVRVVAFVVSLVVFVLVRTMSRGLPWWASVALAVVAMLVAGRLASVVAIDVLGRLHRRRQAEAEALRSRSPR